MKDIEDGGGAFPFTIGNTTCGGMTLRDYLAAKAMAALLVSPGQQGDEARMDDRKLACWSYQCADAMIAEGKKR